ncbi:hypothetical protein H3N56_01060 [Cetobacterium sp. 2A]|uniref:hypothetical protein n=1 Tax=Cetobacterium sp. 2A TaxID=2754723 RepID=UPI00163C3ACA|nr:hypothetical protein [Cetobacterium sp. 2A]MBC2855082.1 hypothetical protein [Cetobacterium sp. 2A]
MKKLLMIGTLLISFVVRANVFDNNEYSKYQIYLNEEQQKIFEEIFWKYDLEIKRNEKMIEILEIKKDSKIEIEKIEQDIKNIILNKKLELKELEKDFLKNPQRYNITI